MIENLDAKVADTILELYHETPQVQETRDHRLPLAVKKLLHRGTRHFMGALLFAYDSDVGGGREGFYVRRNGCVVESLRNDLEKLRDEEWRWYPSSHKETRLKLCAALAEYAHTGESAVIPSDLKKQYRYIPTLDMYGTEQILRHTQQEDS